MGDVKFILYYFAVFLITSNCQSTTSNQCNNLTPSCSNVAQYNSDLITQFEKELQLAKNERDLLKTEVTNLRERLLGEPDCAKLYQDGERASGVYKLNLTDTNNTKHEIEVYCDMKTDGGGWTVFQRRFDGSVPFNRSWEEYKYGFGKKSGEYWLGNYYISLMTNSYRLRYTLRIDFKSFDGQSSYTENADFKVEPEYNKYRLRIGTYSGTAKDEFYIHNKQFFSTRDRDNDEWADDHCSQHFGYGGFWYKQCYHINLNGRYLPRATMDDTGIKWRGSESLQATSMMFRPMFF